MSKTFPILNKLIDKSCVDRHFDKCPKKNAFEFIEGNVKLSSFFKKKEKELTDLNNKVSAEIENFLSENMTAAMKKKIGKLVEEVKKESEEKKARKLIQKAALEGPAALEKLQNNLKKSGNDNLDFDENDNTKSNVQNHHDDDTNDGVADYSDDDDFENVDKNKKKNNANTLLKLTDLKETKETKPDIKIDVSDITNFDGPLTPSPKRSDAPKVNRILNKFEKSNMFTVCKDGKILGIQNIQFNSEKNQIQVSLSA